MTALYNWYILQKTFACRNVFHVKFMWHILSNRRSFGRSKRRVSAAQSTSSRWAYVMFWTIHL